MDPQYLNELVRYLTRAALSGVSKTNLLRSFKESYDLTDQEVNHIVQICNFKKKPGWINYDAFYNNPIAEKATQIKYPFTQIYAYKNFLTKEECDELIRCIDESARKSTIANPDDSQITSDYRTSQTADLDYFPSELIFDIDEKIEKLIELDPFLGEGMQAQKYDPGQYYKEHWDFFPPDNKKEYEVYCEWMGQRTWTTMMYLNAVEKGGETYFKKLNLKIKPEQGLLIAWNNLYRNGKQNYKTMHEALPPIKGTKYVITKWWRSWSLI